MLLLAGCHGAPGAVVPANAEPISSAQVAQWVAATVPKDHRIHKFKWLFRDEKSSAGGRGSARIAPPDSMRFDVAGPFGSGASSAAVVGDTPLWIEPPDAIKKMVPSYPLMWAMFGVARMPAPGTEVRGVQDEHTTAWEYADGGDTIAYVRTPGKPQRMVTTVRRGGELVGKAETTLDSLGVPVTARLTVPSVPARLDLTFLSTARADFAPDIWAPHKP
ncbi:MAG TPA: hypothetical protein VJQ44_04965 [Gemmatimonadales bacterium]|nr:hypothetical protein [Gemmatimonadales bacterium]